MNAVILIMYLKQAVHTSISFFSFSKFVKHFELHFHFVQHASKLILRISIEKTTTKMFQEYRRDICLKVLILNAVHMSVCDGRCSSDVYILGLLSKRK